MVMQKISKLVVVSISLVLLASCDMSLKPDEPWEDDLPEMSEHLGIYVSNKKERFWITINSDGTYRLCDARECNYGPYWGNSSTSIELGGFYSYPVGIEISKRRSSFIENEAFLDKRHLEEQAEREKVPNGFGFTAPFSTKDCTNSGNYCIGFGLKEDGVWFRRVYTFPKTDESDMPPSRPIKVELYGAG